MLSQDGQIHAKPIVYNIRQDHLRQTRISKATNTFVKSRTTLRTVVKFCYRTLIWYDLLTHDEEPFNSMPGFFEAATCFFIESLLKRFMILCLFSVDPPRLYSIDSLTDVNEKEWWP